MLIKNGRLIDPSVNVDDLLDLRIEGEVVKEIGANLQPEIDEEIIDAKGLVVSPGFIDTHVHFRDPGFTYKEDILTGSESAAAGGYTSVICMANTNPIMDNKETLGNFLEKAKNSKINVYTVCALTKGFKGDELVEMEELVEQGCVGFSDDGIPNTNSKVILEGMERAKKLNVPISFHEEDPLLNKENGINHGDISSQMGIYGAPSVSEDIMVARDGALSLYTGAKICIQHISSKNSVDLVRYYKSKGAKIVAESTPHHFSSTEKLLLEKKAMAKMNPPLSREEDKLAIQQGLKDGTIEIIATDHAPHSDYEKSQDLLKAPSGIIGLETALALGITNLVRTGVLTLEKFLEKLTLNPAKFYNLNSGKLEVGDYADIVIFDPDEEFEVKNFKSKSSNSPYIGEKLYGKVKYTFVKGKKVFEEVL